MRPEVAVASLTREGHLCAPRNFGPPKRSSVKAWYKAATQQIPEALKWEPYFEDYADVSVDTIIFHGPTWTLFISRAKYLRG